jgi:hypothetical protein
MDKIKIAKLLLLNEEELLIELGKTNYDTQSSELGIKFPSIKRLKESGKKWFDENWNKYKNLICENENIKALLSQGDKVEDIHLATSIYSIFEHIYVEIHATLITVIILKKGLTKICGPNG